MINIKIHTRPRLWKVVLSKLHLGPEYPVGSREERCKRWNISEDRNDMQQLAKQSSGRVALFRQVYGTGSSGPK